MSQNTVVEKVRERVLQLAREIEALSRSETPPEEFFPQFLDRLVRSLGADAGVVWLLKDGQQLDVEALEGDRKGDVVRCFVRANIDSLVTGDRVVWRPGKNGRSGLGLLFRSHITV